MVRRFVVAVVAAGVVVGLVGAPASAQTKTRKDRAGDAAAQVDIRSTKVQNNGTNFAVTVRLARVVKRQTSVAIGFGRDDEAETDAVLVEAYPVAKGRYRVRAVVGNSDTEVRALRCARGGVTVKTGSRGFFRFVIPQSCLGSLAGRQVAQAAAYDKRDLPGGIIDETQAARQLRQGDVSGDDVDDIPFDSTSLITTSRG